MVSLAPYLPETGIEQAFLGFVTNRNAIATSWKSGNAGFS
jgi:hypothetical protein